MAREWTAISLLVFAAVVASASPAFAQSGLQAQCSASGIGSTCTFTNTGDEAESGCVQIVLSHRADGRMLQTGAVCSGMMEPSTTGQPIPTNFLRGDPSELCSGPDPGGIRVNCDMRVEMLSTHRNAPFFGPWFWILLVFVVTASAVWVHQDSRKLGIKDSSQYVLGTLLLWAIVFPWYLFTRRKLAVIPSPGGDALAPRPPA
jgi:hypothetical protein